MELRLRMIISGGLRLFPEGIGCLSGVKTGMSER